MAELSEIELKNTDVTSSKKWLRIVLIVTLVLASSAGAWYFFAHYESTPRAEDFTKPEIEGEPEQNKPPVFVELEPFTVNLQPDGQFLQATFNVQVSEEKEAEAMKLYMPQIRSHLLIMLSGKTAESLTNQEGKTALINEIENMIQQPFTKGAEPIKIINVFVTSFIIQ